MFAQEKYLCKSSWKALRSIFMMATYKSNKFCIIIQLQNASKLDGMRQHVAGHID
jgi:hypothetical protein